MELFKLFGTIAINNESANKEIDETVGKAKTAEKETSADFGKIGAAATKSAKILGKGMAAAVAAIYGVTEATRDYRTDMGKLDTAFTVNGHSSEVAAKTYKELQSILGDSSQAVEAANHLALLCNGEAELQSWTDICTGVFATFGDSLPIEGLTEAANETAKVGKVTGTLADALNWAGISEDEFNAKLSDCSTEQERQKMITDTLRGAYSKASEQYKATNKDVIASNAAHEDLNAALAGMGAAAEPAVATLVSGAATLVRLVTPVVKALSDTVVGLGNAWNALLTTVNNTTLKVGTALGYDIDENSFQEAADKINNGEAKKSLQALGSVLVTDMFMGGKSQKSQSADDTGMSIYGYAEGGVFNKPTFFDTRLGKTVVAEGGEAEAVAPISVLQGYVAAAVASQNAGIANALERVVEAIESMDANMGSNMRDALEETSLKVNNREFARMVKAVV